MDIKDIQNRIVMNILNHMEKNNQMIKDIVSKTNITEERLTKILDIDANRTITLAEIYSISKSIGLPFHKAMDINSKDF